MELRSASRLLFTQMKHKLKLMGKQGLPHNRNSIFHFCDVSPRLVQSRTDPMYLQSVPREPGLGRGGEEAVGSPSSPQGSWQPLCRMDGTRAWQSLAMASRRTLESQFVNF